MSYVHSLVIAMLPGHCPPPSFSAIPTIRLYKEIIDICPNLSSLALWEGGDLDAVRLNTLLSEPESGERAKDLGKGLQLRRLSCTFPQPESRSKSRDGVTESGLARSYASRLSRLSACLTHLHILIPLQPSSSWEWLSAFTSLTHLAIESPRLKCNSKQIPSILSDILSAVPGRSTDDVHLKVFVFSISFGVLSALKLDWVINLMLENTAVPVVFAKFNDPIPCPTNSTNPIVKMLITMDLLIMRNLNWFLYRTYDDLAMDWSRSTSDDVDYWQLAEALVRRRERMKKTHSALEIRESIGTELRLAMAFGVA
jgi:hypothetical protein